MKPLHDYYLFIDDEYYFFPIKVWKEGECYLLKSKNFTDIIVAWDVQELYTKFENKLLDTIRDYHITAQIWKILPEAKIPFAAQTCRLVAYPYVPEYKKFISRVLRKWKA